jgi:GAF domain-containing protein
MPAPGRPADETERLAALHDYDILDSEAEQTTDDLVHLAGRIAGTPMSLISLVDAERQWFKASSGFDDTETPRETSFCGWAVLGREPLVVPDALEDDRFSDNPSVLGTPNIRFYAGFPLVTPGEHVIGTLCVLDTAPAQLSDAQHEDLARLARLVMTHLEARRNATRLAEALREVRTLGELIPICAHCRRIREDDAYHRTLEQWLQEHTGTRVSHGICPDCMREHFPEFADR